MAAFYRRLSSKTTFLVTLSLTLIAIVLAWHKSYFFVTSSRIEPPTLRYKTLTRNNTTGQSNDAHILHGIQSELQVPKIIHQIWDSELVPNEFVDNVKGLVALNPYPEWKYYFWPLTVGTKFIERKYPSILKLYEAAPNLLKADILRILVVHQYGGAYFDLDTVGVKPFKPFVESTSCSMVNVPPENYINKDMVVHVEFLTNNAFLCRANHPFFSAIIQQLETQSVTCKSAIPCAGPFFISGVFHELKRKKETFDMAPSVASYQLFNDVAPGGLKEAPNKVCSGKNYENTEFWRRKLCDEIRMRGGSNRKLSELAYSYHTWFSVVSHKVTIDSKNNIKSIVPHVKIYE